MKVPPPIPPLAKRIVVEPLDAERLTRIERNVVSRAVDAAPARAPRRWVGFALAVGATAMAAGVAGWLAHGRALGTGGGRGGDVTGVAQAPLAVHTDAQASTLDIGDATIASSPATAFVVTRPEGGVLVDMQRGKVELDVAKRGARPPLVVRAGDTDVIVIGTHFTVDYGDGHGDDVDVRVREGRVRIVHAQHETFVASGQEWTSHAGLVAMVDLTGSGSDAAGSDATDGSGATIGEPTGSGSDQVAIKLGPGPNVLHDRVAVLPDAHKPPVTAHKVSVGSGSDPDRVAGSNGEILSQGAKKWIDQSKDDPHQIRADIHQIRLKPALDAGTVEPTQAVMAYLKLLNDKDAGSLAMYSIALVDHTKRGRNDDALHMIDNYLSRFGHGPELADMLWLRVRILCMDRKLDAACHAAARAYLDQAPEGPGAHVAELITLTE